MGLQAGLRDELGSVVILVVLYMMQGVPLGLTMGAMCVPTQASRSLVALCLQGCAWRLEQ